MSDSYLVVYCIKGKLGHVNCNTHEIANIKAQQAFDSGASLENIRCFYCAGDAEQVHSSVSLKFDRGTEYKHRNDPEE